MSPACTLSRNSYALIRNVSSIIHNLMLEKMIHFLPIWRVQRGETAITGGIERRDEAS